MSGDPNDRASRLAGRWGSESEMREEGTEGESAGGAEVEESADGAGLSMDEAGVEEASDDGGEERALEDRELTTREMQSQMLYLPPAFHKELDLTFEELNLRFRRERDRKLEKNKDFYAGLLRLGLERMGDLRDRDLDEVEELLDL